MKTHDGEYIIVFLQDGLVLLNKHNKRFLKTLKEVGETLVEFRSYGYSLSSLYVFQVKGIQFDNPVVSITEGGKKLKRSRSKKLES